MRIAMLSWESLHSIAAGGVAVHVTELAAALQRRGHELHVFTRRHGEQRYHEWIDGVAYHRCDYQAHPDFVDDVNNMCRAFVERVSIVEDMTGRFDLVHAHDWLAGNAMIWLKQGRGRKSFFTFHSTEFARSGNEMWDGRSVRIREQERAGAYWADHVICVSHATRGEVHWMYEAPEWKTSVIYNGVSPHRFSTGVDAAAVKSRLAVGSSDPMILFCGRMEWQKGPDILVEAMPRVLDRHVDAKFVFAGEGGMRPAMEQRVRQLGVASAARFLGFRNSGELPELFQSNDGVCVPSRNEPFGIVVLEAWSAGKPVVATQVGGPNEYVEHEITGLKIAPHPESVASGLSALLADCTRARWMGSNGRRLVDERFTWDTIARQTEEIYRMPEAEKGEAARRAAVG